MRATHAVFVVAAEADEAQAWLVERHPELTLDERRRARSRSTRRRARRREFVERFALAEIAGSHALGHTRMATESRVTTEHSHPFSTGLDLCLVHNGSLSNHNRLRRDAARARGSEFRTDNDSEVAAGYLTWRLREGATLEQALEGCLDDLDGFYTFAVGTADGFAVLRDPIACKPAVMAETDEWVAMASEYRAIAVLPGAEDAVAVGARAGPRLQLGHRGVGGVMAGVGVQSRARRCGRSTSPSRRCATSTRVCTSSAPPDGAGGRRGRSTRAGEHAIAVGLDAAVRGRDRRARRLLLRRHEQARDRARARQLRRRRGREHDVGRRWSSRAAPASRPGATARGGLLVIHGDASARCGISLKGADIVVRGSVGHMSAFMAQRGCLVVCGDAGEALGDSLYEARLYVRGVGRRARRRLRREGDARRARRPRSATLLARAGVDDVDPAEFRRYGSARRLYNFHVDNLGSY